MNHDYRNDVTFNIGEMADRNSYFGVGGGGFHKVGGVIGAPEDCDGLGVRDGELDHGEDMVPQCDLESKRMRELSQEFAGKPSRPPARWPCAGSSFDILRLESRRTRRPGVHSSGRARNFSSRTRSLSFNLIISQNVPRLVSRGTLLGAEHDCSRRFLPPIVCAPREILNHELGVALM